MRPTRCRSASAGNERKIVNVADGTIASGSTDAVTGGQLFTANQRVAAAFGTTLDANNQLVAPSYTIQGTAYNNVGGAFGAVDSALTTLSTQINDGTIGLVQQNPMTRTITVGAATDGTVVNVAGTQGNRVITGVAPGAVSAGSSDAVNGAQLYATNQQVATLSSNSAANTQQIADALGGGAGVDGNGVLTAPSYAVQGQTFDNVGGALGALDSQVTATPGRSPRSTAWSAACRPAPTT